MVGEGNSSKVVNNSMVTNDESGQGGDSENESMTKTSLEEKIKEIEQKFNKFENVINDKLDQINTKFGEIYTRFNDMEGINKDLATRFEKLEVNVANKKDMVNLGLKLDSILQVMNKPKSTRSRSRPKRESTPARGNDDRSDMNASISSRSSISCRGSDESGYAESKFKPEKLDKIWNHNYKNVKFTGEEKPKEFLEEFEYKAGCLKLDCQSKTQLFPRCLESKAAKWFQTTIGFDNKLSWKTIKEKFLNKFWPRSHSIKAGYKIKNLKMKREESMEQFITRFEDLNMAFKEEEMPGSTNVWNRELFMVLPCEIQERISLRSDEDYEAFKCRLLDVADSLEISNYKKTWYSDYDNSKYNEARNKAVPFADTKYDQKASTRSDEVEGLDKKKREIKSNSVQTIRAGSTRLAMIPVNINGEKATAAADTGAEVTILSKVLAKKLKLDTTKSKISAQLADGSNLNNLEVGAISLEILGKTKIVNVLIMKKTLVDLLIGMDLMEIYEMSVFVNNKLVVVKGANWAWDYKNQVEVKIPQSLDFQYLAIKDNKQSSDNLFLPWEGHEEAGHKLINQVLSPDGSIIEHIKSNEQANINSDLDNDSKNKIIKVLAVNAKAFATSADMIGKAGHVRHSIVTGAVKPIKQREYRTSIKDKNKASAAIKEMLNSGIISRSNSPWSSPNILVPKNQVDFG